MSFHPQYMHFSPLTYKHFFWFHPTESISCLFFMDFLREAEKRQHQRKSYEWHWNDWYGASRFKANSPTAWNYWTFGFNCYWMELLEQSILVEKYLSYLVLIQVSWERDSDIFRQFSKEIGQNQSRNLYCILLTLNIDYSHLNITITQWVYSKHRPRKTIDRKGL